jgi:hypothetical protein
LLRILTNGKWQAVWVNVDGQFGAMLGCRWPDTGDALRKHLRVEEVDIVRPEAELTSTAWRLGWRRAIGIGNRGRV